MTKIQKFKTKKAFSLYEMLIVMAIIVLVAAITIPVLNNYLPSLKLSSSAKAVLTKLRQAQEEAVTTQAQHKIFFETSTTPPNIQFIKVGPGAGTTLETVTLANGITLGVSFTDASDTITFSADGGPSTSGNITVTLGESAKTINVTPAGVIKLLQ